MPRIKYVMLISLMFIPLSIHAESKKPNPQDKVFYVYLDGGSRENHYCPANWMGDYDAIKFNQNYREESNKVIRVAYSTGSAQNANWAGVYWADPCNNWGDKRGGFDLTGYKNLRFKAKGEKGGEYIEFFAGGITGQIEDGDSDRVGMDAVSLTKEWKDYAIDLKGSDLSHIIGGFGFSTSLDYNPDGIVFYLDDIRYTK